MNFFGKSAILWFQEMQSLLGMFTNKKKLKIRLCCNNSGMLGVVYPQNCSVREIIYGFTLL